MKIFGTNGIRGVVNDYLTCKLTFSVGRSAGSVLGKRIAVAIDHTCRLRWSRARCAQG